MALSRSCARLVRLYAVRPVSEPPDRVGSNPSVLQVVPEGLGDDSDGIRAAGDPELSAFHEACDPRAARDAALLGRAPHEILEDDAVRDAVAARGSRREHAAGEGRAGADDDVRAPPPEDRRRSEPEERQLVQPAL